MGRAKNHTITANADGSFTVQDNVGNGGTDTLVDVERLQFLDRLIELQAPTDIAPDFESVTTQTIQTRAGEAHSTTEQISLTVNPIADNSPSDVKAAFDFAASHHAETFHIDGLDVTGIEHLELQVDSVLKDPASPYLITHVPELFGLMHAAEDWGLLTV